MVNEDRVKVVARQAKEAAGKVQKGYGDAKEKIKKAL